VHDKAGLTQEQFAIRYDLDLDAVRNREHGRVGPGKSCRRGDLDAVRIREHGRRQPDTAAWSHLRIVNSNPAVVKGTLWRS